MAAACGGADAPAPTETNDRAAASAAAAPTPAPALDAGVDAVAIPPNVVPEIDAVCAEEAAAYCNALTLKVPDVIAWQYGDTNACQSRMSAGCKLVLSQPDTGWTVVARRACAQAWASATVDELLAINAVPLACRAPAGKKADQAACLFGSECASRSCIVAPGAGCGICAPPIQAGAPCGGSLQCADGLECNYDATEGAARCGPLRATPGIGTSCTAHTQCGRARYCRGTYTYVNAAWSIENGTCQAYSVAAVGGACGDFTGPGTPTSVPLLDAKVCVESYCKYPSPTASQGTCLPRPADGQPCDVASGCAGVSLCRADVCVSYAALQCK